MKISMITFILILGISKMAYSGKIEDPEEDDSKIKSKDREKRGKDLKGSILDGKIDTC